MDRHHPRRGARRHAVRCAIAIAGALAAASCAPRPTAPPPPRPDLRYYVRPAEKAPLLQVSLVAENLKSDSLDFTFPVWLPGDFRPIEPGKWVEDVRAYDRATVELPVRRLGANLWRVYPRGAPYFLVTWTLHPVRPDGFKRATISELAHDGGWFTGAVALGYLKGLETYPATLTFELAAGRGPAICSLEEDGPARYRAADAHELAGAGCAYGPRLRELRTTAAGVPHRVVLSAPAGFAPDSLLRVVRDVVDAQARLFRAVPYPEYTMFLHFVEPAMLGLGGTPLFRGSAYYLPEVPAHAVRGSGIPALLAHQLFHAWNLWTFPPADLERPALDRPVVSRALWLVEGLAEHYARVSLARAGVLPRNAAYDAVARNLRALAAEPAASRANLETASVAATRGETRDVLDPLALKSPLAVLALDVETRRASGNAFGLDSLLRRLEGGPDGEPWVAPYDTLVAAVIGLGGPAVRSLYASAIAGSGALPAAEILAAAGLDVQVREIEEATLGASLVPDTSGAFVFRNVIAHGIGGQMGLRTGDRLIAVNAQPVTRDNLLPLLAVLADLRSGQRVGKPIAVRVERHGREVELRGSLVPWRRQVTVVTEDSAATPAETAVREAIFAGRRTAPAPATAEAAQPAEGNSP
jgi:predicted metalloprotease with PDZ domain